MFPCVSVGSGGRKRGGLRNAVGAVDCGVEGGKVVESRNLGLLFGVGMGFGLWDVGEETMGREEGRKSSFSSEMASAADEGDIRWRLEGRVSTS